MKALTIWLAVVAGVTTLPAWQAAAQQDELTGIAIEIAPEFDGHTLVVSDADGKELDRIEGLSAGVTYEYTFPAREYHVRLPGVAEPVGIKPGQADLFTLGLGGETSEAGYGLTEASTRLDPAGNELIFSLDPGKDTRDPGPEAK